jgi:osmotically-inducible protein OsmY
MEEWGNANTMKLRTSIFGAAMVVALCCLCTPAFANSDAVVDVTPQLSSLHIDGLSAVQVGGIVILRGRTADPALAQQAGAIVKQSGYNRVANLIQVSSPPDDAAIERTAERRLAMQRSLDGCKLRVDSNAGVLTVAGKVDHELQKDIAVDLLRQIDGVRSVRADLLTNRPN